MTKHVNLTVLALASLVGLPAAGALASECTHGIAKTERWLQALPGSLLGRRSGH